MRVSTVRTYPTDLPATDPHPYRSGAWAPNRVEVDAYELDVPSGEIPRDLAGVYLRNTENPLWEALAARYHPFDGDGMLHAIRFEDGVASYRNRFVPTRGFERELSAGRALWTGILEDPARSAPEGWGARTRMKDASSTDVTIHAGLALTTFYQCGDGYLTDPVTLAPRGIAALDHPSFPRGATLSAHPKVDPLTGELLFFNYGTAAPYGHVGIADRTGALARTMAVPFAGPRLPHDMAFTKSFVILGDFPLFWDPAKLADGKYRARYYPELGSRFALVPRDGAGDVRWFSAASTYVLHFANAYEEGAEVVLEGYFQGAPVPERAAGDTLVSAFMKSLDMHAMKTRLHRWRFDLETGRTREEPLDDACTEFPTIHAGYAGRRNRYVYAAIGEPGWFLFSGLTRTDLDTGSKSSYRFPKGVFASVAPFCPRVGATAEDDGYLVTFTTQASEDASECWIFDARDLERGPIARVRLPHRIASGTHATWAPAADLRA